MQFTTHYKTEIGLLEITGSGDGISAITFVDDKDFGNTVVPQCLKECYDQLDEYFHQKRKMFDFKMDLQGTDFQKSVWNALTKIPFGKTASYQDVAEMVGDANSTRAVGNANGKNPIVIVVPCHRVINKDGKMGGYSAGVWRKKWLLDFEQNKILK